MARTMCTPNVWHANDATAPACSIRPHASNARSSSDAYRKAASRTRDAKRCRAKRWRSQSNAPTMWAAWRRSPFDSTDTATWWPNLWQRRPGTSSARTRSVSAMVLRSSGQNSRSLAMTSEPPLLCAAARAWGANSSATKAASSVPTWRITCCSTSCACIECAARMAQPCKCSAILRASAGPASSRARPTALQPSSSKARATMSAPSCATPTGACPRASDSSEALCTRAP
mmetsp:Transcript_3973/g.11507  ORF Transcript_3973/g.11507 Transcript_3973/m.11507 type:complete len:230 (+) Transcript_3973:259-948(+)